MPCPAPALPLWSLRALPAGSTGGAELWSHRWQSASVHLIYKMLLSTPREAFSPSFTSLPDQKLPHFQCNLQAILIGLGGFFGQHCVVFFFPAQAPLPSSASILRGTGLVLLHCHFPYLLPFIFFMCVAEEHFGLCSLFLFG